MSQTDYFNGSTNNRQQMEQSFKKIAFILELQVRNKTRYDGEKKNSWIEKQTFCRWKSKFLRIRVKRLYCVELLQRRKFNSTIANLFHKNLLHIMSTSISRTQKHQPGKFDLDGLFSKKGCSTCSARLFWRKKAKNLAPNLLTKKQEQDEKNILFLRVLNQNQNISSPNL